jgi:ABC-type phosphonate transport system ATPase subunit
MLSASVHFVRLQVLAMVDHFVSLVMVNLHETVRDDPPQTRTARVALVRTSPALMAVLAPTVQLLVAVNAQLLRQVRDLPALANVSAVLVHRDDRELHRKLRTHH